jgi:hypothetical protein
MTKMSYSAGRDIHFLFGQRVLRPMSFIVPFAGMRFGGRFAENGRNHRHQTVAKLTSAMSLGIK